MEYGQKKEVWHTPFGACQTSEPGWNLYPVVS